MNAIEIRGLTKRYDDFTLDNVSFTLPTGCILGLAGENGAGKSTTIRCMLGAAGFESGSIRVLGMDSKEQNFHEVKHDIGVVLDNVGFPYTMNATQIGKMMAATYRNWDMPYYDSLLTRFKLPAKKKFGDFSRGMRMKLGIAVAMAHHPRLLILDEATSGLDPVVRDEVVEMFYEFTRDENNSVLISSHILSDLEKLCDYVAFMREGKLLLCEEKDTLLERYASVLCTDEQMQEIGSGKCISCKRTPYGMQAVLRREDVPAGMNAAPIGMEELFVAMVKGGGDR